jgi:hypothetical protein
VTTQWCGQHYTQTLADNTAKEASIKRAFIDKYKIDMTQFTPEVGFWACLFARLCGSS